MVSFQAKSIVLFRDGRPKKKICQEWWFGHGRGGQVFLRHTSKIGFAYFVAQILYIPASSTSTFMNPGRKPRTNFLFLFRKKSSKMDFVKMLLGLAASHLGGLAVCALYAGTWRKFIYRAIKQVHVSVSNLFFLSFFLFCNLIFIFVAQCWASGLFSQWKARQRWRGQTILVETIWYCIYPNRVT